MPKSEFDIDKLLEVLYNKYIIVGGYIYGTT